MESEDVMTFCETDFPRISFAAFEDMRRIGDLCDVRINASDRHSVLAHRVILAAAIPYFRSVFCGSPLENKFSLGNVDPDALETLIHFAYSGRVNISTKNAYSLLLAADFLQINQVRDSCVKFLSNKMSISNVVQVRRLAHSLNNLALIESSHTYMRENFEEFSKSDEFLSVSDECVKEIISEDVLNVSCETVVFESVIRWVKFSPSERQDILPELLNEVRMIYLPTGYLIKNVASEELIRVSFPCRDIIDKTKCYHILPKEELQFLNLKTQPRQSSYIKSVIYGVPERGNSIYCCDFTNESWCLLQSKAAEHTFPSKFVEIASLKNGSIYLFLQNTVERFNLKSLEWELLEPRHECLKGAAVSSHGNVIYCFGSFNIGFDDRVRRFDTRQNNWMKEEKMNLPRNSSAAATLGDFIYVTGGKTTRTNFYMRNQRFYNKYNVSTGQWSEIASMLTPRSNHGCTTLNGKIYVCGGRSSGLSIFNSAEMYNPVTDQWNAIASMNTGKECLSLITRNNKIYALGGLIAPYRHALKFEIYDPENDQWKSGFSVPEEIRCYVV